MNNSFYKISLILVTLLFSFSWKVNAQDSLIIKGKVFSTKNVPVANVSISVEGMEGLPVLTDEEGQFELKVNSWESWLMVTPSDDFKPKRIFLNGRDELTISLTPNNLPSGFDEMNINHQKTIDRNIVSSVEIIKSENHSFENLTSPDQIFSSGIPGVYSIAQSGMPGRGSSNFIRGINSLTTSGSPYIIVDGLPFEQNGLFESVIEGNNYNPLYTINPWDVSTVTILKDPVTTSMYGSKGANGVILINTLEPGISQTSIEFSVKQGVSFAPSRFIPQLNDAQYKMLASEILSGSSQLGEFLEEDYPGLYLAEGEEDYYRYANNTNWQENIFKGASLTDAYFSIKSSTEILRYALSVGYHDEDGIFDNSNLNRFTVRLATNMGLFAWLRLKVNASLSSVQTNTFPSIKNLQINPVRNSLAKAPIMAPYVFDDIGAQLSFFDEPDELGVSNPAAIMNNYKGLGQNYRFTSTISGHADFTRNLSFHVLMGINLNTMRETVYLPNIGIEDYDEGIAINKSLGSNNFFNSFYNDNYFVYKKSFNTNHELSVTAGLRVNTNVYKNDFGQSENLPEDDQYTQIQSGESDSYNIGGLNGAWNWLSTYSQLNYIFKDKYVLSSSLSADYSTLTGKEAETSFSISGYPFGFFYSLGAGWRLSSEDFLKNIDGLENLFLRASYGITGNDDIGLYSTINYYTVDLYRQTATLIRGALPNMGLKYEKVNQLNVGLDVSLWGDRTTLMFNYFDKKTDGMILNQPKSAFLGFSNGTENIGEISNSGIELSLSQRIIDRSDFTIDLGASVTFIENKVLSLGDANSLITSFEGGELITSVGDPIAAYYGYKYEGVFSTAEEANLASLYNASGVKFGPGDAKFQDISGPDDIPDGIIDSYDKTILGSPLPDLFGNFFVAMNYKNWHFNSVIQFTSGNQLYNYVRYMNERMVDVANQSSNVLRRWQVEGDETDVPRALWKDPVGNSAFSSRWIEEGSFVRLKSVSLAYKYPTKLAFFKDVQVYLTATNLFTQSKYLGYDPEYSYSNKTIHQGVDYGLMPQSRKFMIGVKFGL